MSTTIVKRKNVSLPDEQTHNWKKFHSRNSYYHTHLLNLTKEIIPLYASVLEFGSRGGELLHSLPNKKKTGIEYRKEFLQLAKKQYPKDDFQEINDLLKKRKYKSYDYVLFTHTSYDIPDVQTLIKQCRKLTHKDSRIVVYTFNFAWRPLLSIAESVGLKLPATREPAWLTDADLDNMFYLESYEKIRSGKTLLLPIEIPFISSFVNKYVANFPIINSLCLMNYSIYRPIVERKAYSTSIIIPARNEEGNMKGLLRKIPRFSKKMEVIFVEGHSKDNTYSAIKNEILKYNGSIKASLYKQKGKGKGDAVRLGFEKAKNELLMILDADLTVDPKELLKFYEAACGGKGDLIMGSRLVYPMEKQAMRNLNYIGNKLFSLAFSFLLGQRIKDTLCGTKVLLKTHYDHISQNRHFFGDFDPFGDYDLIFGASKLNLKIVEIPIRYKERTYGTTNISRFQHGFLLFQMVLFAAKKLKFK